MKRLYKVLSALLLFSASAILRAAPSSTPLSNVQMSGADNQVKSGATLTIKSGGTFTIEGGGTITGVQSTDATLTAIAGQTTAANKLTFWDGVDDANTIDFSPVSQAFLGYTTAAAWRNAIFPTTAAEGDLITHDGTNWIRLAIGTTGQVLTTQADGTFAWDDFAPTFAAEDISYDPAASGLSATDVQAAIDELDTAIATKGDASGPSSSTDNALARFDSTTGKLLQNSTTTLSDAGAFAFADGVRQTFNPDGTNAGLNVGSQAGDPSSSSNGDLWYDSTANELTARIAGSNVALGAGGGGGSAALFVGRSAKAANYTVVAGDKGYVIDIVGGAPTISFTAAATLGDGFFVAVFNSLSGAVTLDPNGSETIQDLSGSATSRTLAQGQGIILFCNGSGFYAVSQTTSADVVGPASSTANRLATFSGTSGKVIQDGATLTATSDTLSASSVLTLSGTNIILNPSSNYTRTTKNVFYDGSSAGSWAGTVPDGFLASRNGITGYYSHAASSDTEYRSLVTGGATSGISATGANQKASFVLSVMTSVVTFPNPAQIDLITKVAPTGSDQEAQIDFYATPSGSGTAVNAASITGNGLLTRVPVVARTTALTVTDAQSSTYFTNEGATAQVVFTLPTAAANRRYTFIVQDTDGLRVTAASGDTIRIAGTVSGAAGYVESTTIGNTITLVSINATEWIATAVNGTWTFSP